MSKELEVYLSNNNITGALNQCLRDNNYHLGLLLAKFYQTTENSPEFLKVFSLIIEAVKKESCEGDEIKNSINTFSDPHNDPSSASVTSHFNEDKSTIRIMLLCNWCDSRSLCDNWNKMSKGNYRWNNIQIVWEKPADYFVVINCPPITIFPPLDKTILFQMEPNMQENKKMWGDWSNPPAPNLKFCGTHATEYNNNEWHLAKTYTELSSQKVSKETNVANILSTVLSDKYKDPGHIKRIDFIKFLESKNAQVHVWGGNKFDWKQYKGSLEPHAKDQAMFPYKYVFNAENHDIRNYYTEKIIDGILAECLVFYWGCPNIRDFIDERAFVKLELVDFESDYKTILKAINENWWEKRLPFIKAAKKKILNETQFFPRLEKIVSL